MTRSIALGMLRQGNTGSEIMQILDVIVNDIVEENNIALQKLNDAIRAQSWVLCNIISECYRNPSWHSEPPIRSL